MACFDNILALKETCTSDTTSGYYLNDFGVNKKEIEAIITSEYDNVQNFVDEKIRFNVDIITNDVVNHFRQVRAKTLVQSHRVGIFNKNKVVTAGGDNRGIHLNVCNTDNFLDVYISEISLLTDFTGTIPVNVYDLTQGKLLDTISVASTAGEVSTAFAHKTYKTSKQGIDLFLAYDTTGINSYKTTIRSGICCGNYTCSNSYVTSKGAKVVSTFTNENLVNLPDTAGLSVLYSVNCDNKGWLCTYLKQIALAVGYKVCSDIMRMGATVSPTTRTNNSTTLNKDNLMERFDWYELKYRETMTNILGNIFLPTDNVCFTCSSPVKHGSAIP